MIKLLKPTIPYCLSLLLAFFVLLLLFISSIAIYAVCLCGYVCLCRNEPIQLLVALLVCLLPLLQSSLKYIRIWIPYYLDCFQ